MNSPIDDYKFFKNVNGIGETAYFNIFEKYIKYGLKGIEKKLEIDSTDQEGIISSKNGGLPLPGMIYIFIYNGPNVMVQDGKKQKEYTDLIPLVFCIASDKESFSGLNMNILPQHARLLFLQSFYESFKDFFKDADTLAQNDMLSINKSFMNYSKSGNSQEMLNIFNKKNSANYNFAYRKYLFGKVEKLRMLEYTEWKYIPLYAPLNVFRKLGQAEMYKLYQKKTAYKIN